VLLLLQVKYKVTKMSKFANAIGIWDLKINGIDIELKPKTKHIKQLRDIIFNNIKDKSKLFSSFEDLMVDLIASHYPDEPRSDIIDVVALNIMSLFEEAMVQFKFSTKEDMLKAKQQSSSDIKKLIGES